MMATAVTGVGSPLPLNREDMHLKYQLSIRWDCVKSQGKCTLNSLMSGEIHTWAWGGGYCTVTLYTRGPGGEGMGLGRRVLYNGTLHTWAWGGGYCTVALYTRGPGGEGTVQ